MGESAIALLNAVAKHTPRLSPIQLMGSGIGSLSIPQMLQATGEILQAAATRGFRIAMTQARLEDVATAWVQDDSKKRTVFVFPQ